MIRLFSRIRRGFLSGNTFSRYLLYAIGEIVLVVLGILIALQINNWNEARREKVMARQYLEGIRDNLKKDLVLLDSVISLYGKDISLINGLDPAFLAPVNSSARYDRLFSDPDTSHVKYMFYRGTSFRPIRATYNSLLADGKSGLIRNKNLFGIIQEIYDERHERINSVYESLKPSENRIHWTYASEKRNWNYTDLMNSEGEQIFLDLANFTEIKLFYSQHLLDLMIRMEEAIAEIDKELDSQDRNS